MPHQLRKRFYLRGLVIFILLGAFINLMSGGNPTGVSDSIGVITNIIIKGFPKHSFSLVGGLYV